MHVTCVVRPHVGETRTITAELTSGPLGIDGINIECSRTNGGIFVSVVEPGSAPSRAGLLVGDQLLEVNTSVHDFQLLIPL